VISPHLEFSILIVTFTAGLPSLVVTVPLMLFWANTAVIENTKVIKSRSLFVIIIWLIEKQSWSDEKGTVFAIGNFLGK
jgi:hypothetical protein